MTDNSEDLGKRLEVSSSGRDGSTESNGAMKAVFPLLGSIVKKLNNQIALFALGSFVVLAVVGTLGVALEVIIVFATVIIFSIFFISKSSTNVQDRGLEAKLDRLKQENEKLRKKILDVEKELQNIKANQSGLLGFEASVDHHSIQQDLNFDGSSIDCDHKYVKLVFHAYVDKEGNYYGKYERKAKRIKPGVTKDFVFRVGASSVLNAKDINLKVIDENEAELSLHKTSDISPTLKEFTFGLKSAVHQHGEFSAIISFCWPKCIVLVRDTDTVDLSIFPEIESLEYALECDFLPASPVLYERHGDQLIISKKRLVPIKNEIGRYVVNFSYEQPKMGGFVIAFSRDDLLV